MYITNIFHCLRYGKGSVHLIIDYESNRMRLAAITSATSLACVASTYWWIYSRKKHYCAHHINAQNPLILDQVYVVFRHGARTITKQNEQYEDLPNIPSYWGRDELLKTLPHLDIPYNLVSEDGSNIYEEWIEKYSRESGPLKVSFICLPTTYIFYQLR